MSSHRICTIGLFAWIALISASAQAATCYLIVDASDKTLYRSRIAPFPLAGPAWDSAQNKMRAQQNYLMWFDATTCAEDYTSPVYAGSNTSRDVTSILAARSDRNPAGIYTGVDSGSDAPTGSSNR